MAEPSVSLLPAGADPIVYYRTRPDESFWSDQWAAESLERLLHVAEASELTRFLERYVHPGTRALEAGCGLGQYVLYFAQRGVRITGVDFSGYAIDAHRAAFPSSDVRRADICRLPFPDARFDVYISLGVIEHYEDGGQAVLTEARRVLARDGVLLLATPYANFSRRLLRRTIESRQRAIGGEFYQYAFDERTLDRILERGGFRVFDRSYYDPGRGIRDLIALVRRRGPVPGSARSRGSPDPATLRANRASTRTLLYARPTLKALAHMQIVAARVAKG